MPVSKVGDWNRVNRVLEGIRELDLEEIVDNTNEELLVFLKEMITEGKLQFAPLNPQYESRKEKKVGDKPTLVSSGKYVGKLRILKVRISSNHIKWLIGAVKGDSYVNGLDMAVIADWLENGTAKMSPKPHYRPVWLLFKHKYEALVTQGLRVQLMTKVGR